MRGRNSRGPFFHDYQRVLEYLRQLSCLDILVIDILGYQRRKYRKLEFAGIFTLTPYGVCSSDPVLGNGEL